ncbi:MAG: amino acid ABC transporter permease [Rhizobiaceae bacterium]|nr:MAG: amino acid ABC transporter permease [Rhizobiaceae bacterium]
MASRDSGRGSVFYDPKLRGIFFQAVLFIALAAFVWWVAANTVANLHRAHIASGFGFLSSRAGFDVSNALIPYSSDSTVARALLVGLLNTLLVSATGIVTATIVGFLVGIGRLTRNWLIRQICTAYIEIFRNIPPLLVIFFWYLGVLSVLPSPRNSIRFPFDMYLNSRGFYMPEPVWGQGAWLTGAGFLVGIVLAFVMRRWAKRRQMATGRQFPVFRTATALVIGFPLIAFALTGFPLSFDVPKASTFNLTGGLQVKPEFLSLYLALSFYTAAFIAEIVRAGILGVARGQTEAAYSLGLKRDMALRLVIVPQALRIIIPPLTSQYLNLTKNSSLAVAVGYADLVAIGGTILNQTGQAIEIVAIWMVVYLGISLGVSLLMNWFNARTALKER